MRLLGAAILGLSLWTAPMIAAAQPYPDRVVRWIQPGPPGGGTDFVGRLMAQKLGDMWGQQVVNEYKAGASGNIGAQVVARSKPDGYTFLMAFNGVLTINPSLFTDMGFDPQRDLVPVSVISSSAYMLVVNPEFPARNAQQLIAHLKANPGKYNWAAAERGTPDHLAGEVFQVKAGVKMEYIPHKGAQEVILAVLANRVSIATFTVAAALGHIKAGKLIPIAVMDTERSSLLPDVPTMAEAGVPDCVMTTSYGLWAPQGTPPAIMEKVGADLRKVLQAPDVREQLANRAMRAVGSLPAESQSLMEKQRALFAQLIAQLGLEKN